MGFEGQMYKWRCDVCGAEAIGSSYVRDGKPLPNGKELNDPAGWVVVDFVVVDDEGEETEKTLVTCRECSVAITPLLDQLKNGLKSAARVFICKLAGAQPGGLDGQRLMLGKLFADWLEWCVVNQIEGAIRAAQDETATELVEKANVKIETVEVTS